jgi:hypothetical protein
MMVQRIDEAHKAMRVEMAAAIAAAIEQERATMVQIVGTALGQMREQLLAELQEQCSSGGSHGNGSDHSARGASHLPLRRDRATAKAI